MHIFLLISRCCNRTILKHVPIIETREANKTTSWMVYFIVSMSLISAVTLKANAEQTQNKLKTDDILCEIFLTDKTTPAYPGFYSILNKTVNARCLVLTHPPVDASAAAYPNAYSAKKKGDPSYPLIIVDGKDKFQASPSTHWQKDLSRLLERDMTVDKWKLEMHLSSRKSRKNNPIVNFSICNMEKTKEFSGSFILWIAEMKTVESNQKGWVAIKKVVEEKIKKLPPAKSMGCSLPDQFLIPELSKEKEYCIISVVQALDLSVQAINLELIMSM